MAVNTNKTEKRNARRIQEYLGSSYTHALRLLREGKYIVRGKVVQKVENDA